jgi:hypothetical protein
MYRLAMAFVPERVGYYECEGWRAYYDHKWVRLLRLLVSLCRQQFSMPWPQAVLGAYYATRASVAWVPLDHDDQKVLRYYEAFYRLARKHSGLKFGPATVARLELRYNDDHRRLTNAEDKTDLLNTLIELHSALFGLDRTAVDDSARHRLAALVAVDRITTRRSIDIDADWRKVYEELVRCYTSVAEAAGKA